MAVTANQIQMARKAGYSDDEIVQHLAATEPQMKQALDVGYKPAEIMAHFDTQPKSEWRQKPGTEGRNVADMQREFIKREGSMGTQLRNTTVTDYIKEPARFAAETGTMIANAGLRGLKGATSLIQGGGEALRTGDINRGLAKFNEKQAEFQPVQSPMAQSAMGEMVGDIAGRGINKLSDITGRPDIVEPVAQGAMDIGALMGLRAATKGVTLADVGRGAKRGVDAAVGHSLNVLPDSMVTPESLTRSALKPYIGDNAVRNRSVSKGIETFLTDRKSASPETFLNKNVAEMEQIVGRQNVLLDQKGDVRADITPIEQSLNNFINEARTTPGTADSAVTAAEKVLSDIKNHPDYNPADNTAGVSTLQTMKKNTWRYLKDKGAFDRAANPQLNDAMWSAADGMAKIVSDTIPEMAAENARYGEIANLNKMLTRSVNRIANTNVISLHSAMQLIRGDWKGFGMAVVMKTIDHPTFKSYLAQQMAKAQGRMPKKYEVNNAVEAIKQSAEQFNPEVLPGKQSSQMDIIPGSAEMGLEQGGIPSPSAMDKIIPQGTRIPLNLPVGDNGAAANTVPRRPLNLPVGDGSFYDPTIGKKISRKQ